MQKDDAITLFFQFDPWATAQMISACEKLTSEQFHKPFDIGPGSLHNTITHILGCIRTWTQTLAGKEISMRLEADGIQRAPRQLMELLGPIYHEFQQEAHRLPLSDSTTRTLKSGKVVTLTRLELFIHVFTHGMHHRAQCLNMIRQLGATPLPPSSVAEWVMMRDFQNKSS
jgi:uncharacterized damage-inducible protein DinB